jgi:hypothetical protein
MKLTIISEKKKCLNLTSPKGDIIALYIVIPNAFLALK